METTLNIRADLLNQITEAADSRGQSRSELILWLIKKVAGEITDYGLIGQTVQYQERRASTDWHIFHIRLREDMYEYWLDLRKLLKMSVSLILAYAIKKYLNRSTKRKDADNYLCKNYIIAREVIDSIVVWKFYWGCPPHLV